MKKIFSMLSVVLGTISASAQTPPIIYGHQLSCSPSLFEVYFSWNSPNDSVNLYAVHDTVSTLDSPYMASTPIVSRPPAINSLDYLTLDVLLGRPAAPGTNYVRVYVQNYLGKDSTAVMSCSSPLKVSENATEKFGVKIYPNPVLSNSEIICSQSIEGNFSLYDVTGRLVRIIEINSGKGNVIAEGLSQGLYAYQLMDNKGQEQDIGMLSVK